MTFLATALIAATLWTAAPTTAPPTTAPASPGKLAPEIGKEMAEAIVAVNKALGLESWPMHGAQPCVDRGGQGVTSRDLAPGEGRNGAAAALEEGFPELGKSCALAVLMASSGPATVIAAGPAAA